MSCLLALGTGATGYMSGWRALSKHERWHLVNSEMNNIALYLARKDPAAAAMLAAANYRNRAYDQLAKTYGTEVYSGSEDEDAPDPPPFPPEYYQLVNPEEEDDGEESDGGQEGEVVFNMRYKEKTLVKLKFPPPRDEVVYIYGGSVATFSDEEMAAIEAEHTRLQDEAADADSEANRLRGEPMPPPDWNMEDSPLLPGLGALVSAAFQFPAPGPPEAPPPPPKRKAEDVLGKAHGKRKESTKSPTMGARVKARFMATLQSKNSHDLWRFKWYIGEITKVHTDGHIDIVYDDGDEEEHVAPAHFVVLDD